MPTLLQQAGAVVTVPIDADMADIDANVDAVDEAIGRAVERDATRAAEIDEATAKEPVIHEFQAEPSLEPSWQQGEVERPPAAAALEADASLGAPEIRPATCSHTFGVYRVYDFVASRCPG